ncbi:BMP family ABC transporter substrate-binding protein [Pseudoflavonifractor sp. MCC625]|nr:BMP family ABC transporter substrate-binding protein [Pseudoflavonifractor sp. MCC625]
MKHWISIGMSAALLFSCISCSSGGASTSEPPESGEPSRASEVKIGMLIPGSPTDGGFSQQGAEACKAIEETYGYEVSLVEAATADSIKQEAENMAAEGYKIVYGHGGQCTSPFAEISPDYPDTWFITLGGNVVTENQFPVCFCGEEGFYVTGVIAGMMSKTGKIAATLGGDYPAYTKATTGFRLGAESVNPDVECSVAVLSAPDPNEAYETTLNQINMGADFILGNCNEGQIGALKAVSENPGVYAIGSLGDFTDQAPESVLVNVVGDFNRGYLEATEAVMSGSIEEPEIMFLTFANECVSLVWNEELKAQIPQEVVDAAEQAVQDIIDGKIDVPNEYELDTVE